MRCILLLSLLYFNSVLLGQSSTIKGRILEADGLEPVLFATVYVNGTTNGSVTDGLGHYELKEVKFPAEIIVSHLSFESQVLYLKEPTDKGLVFHLQLRAVNPKELGVEDKSRRQKNIRKFEKLFLGIDPIGQQAILVNPDVLLFDRRSSIYYKSITSLDIKQKNRKKDAPLLDNMLYTEVPSRLRVKSTAPIFVAQPELGYRIRVDLATFRVTYPTPKASSPNVYWLAYYYFEPYADASKAKQKRYEKNRLSAYYGSTRHFLRSVYEKSLNQNGYRIMITDYDPVNNYNRLVPFDIYQYIEYNDEGEAAFVNLKDKFLEVLYYTNNRGHPMDITKKVSENIFPSRIIFSSDRCIFRANGTMPELSLRFAGELDFKKVGAMLPDDYVPPFTRK